MKLPELAGNASDEGGLPHYLVTVYCTEGRREASSEKHARHMQCGTNPCPQNISKHSRNQRDRAGKRFGNGHMA